jgi:hypothetical protein
MCSRQRVLLEKNKLTFKLPFFVRLVRRTRRVSTATAINNRIVRCKRKQQLVYRSEKFNPKRRVVNTESQVFESGSNGEWCRSYSPRYVNEYDKTVIVEAVILSSARVHPFSI